MNSSDNSRFRYSTGVLPKKWKDNRIRKQRTESNKIRKTIPTFEITKNKEKAIEKHQEMWESKPEHEVWIYTDGSKKDKQAAIAWVQMEGDEQLEEEHGMRVPGEWSITKIEICAMGVALRDMRKLRKKKVRLFSDSMSGITMIKEMKDEGDSASLWETITDILNEWEEVKIVWVPGHTGVEGNKIADRIAKERRNRMLSEEGRWKMVDYEENSNSLIK